MGASAERSGRAAGRPRRFALAQGVAFQPMGADEDTVILALAQGQLFTCNGTATDFLAAVRDGLTLDQTVDRLVELYDIERPVAAADLDELAAQLVAEGLLVELE